MPAGLILAVLLLFLRPASAQEEPLVADLSKHLVAITAGFSGTDVLLFGATDGPGDVIVVVRGPEKAELVRKKARTAGIWINREERRFTDAPQFYHIAATRPLEEMAVKGGDFQRHQIGLANLKLTAQGGEVGEFRAALIRLKQNQGVFSDEVEPINVLGNRLFRTEMHFPANVPVGTYRVEVYLVRERQVVSAQMTPLIIGKIGLGADLYDFAHYQAALYGIAAILIAVAAGWLASVAFRKR
ncbi:MAG: TIGR02186 family protein [Rhodospirillales bacterium]|nr:TIGR02186 family protein [Rhodospirillales bacterium]